MENAAEWSMNRRVVLSLAILGVLFLILEHRSIRDIRERNHMLKASQSNAIGAVNAPLTNDPLVLAELEQLRRENRDLPKLRGEITELRRQNNDLQTLREETERLKRQTMPSQQVVAAPNQERRFVRSDQYAFVGFATPEQTVQSILWALQHKDLPAMLRCLDPESAQSYGPENSNGEYVTGVLSSRLDHFAEAHQVVARKVVAPDEVVLRIRSSTGAEVGLRLHAFGGEWKVMNLAEY